MTTSSSAPHMFHEIIALPVKTDDLFHTLSEPEKRVVYLLWRAGLPFNYMYREQNHRYTNLIILVLESLYQKSRHDNGSDGLPNPSDGLPNPSVNESVNGSVNPLVHISRDIEILLAYYYANQGPYFLKAANRKYSPKQLGLSPSFNREVLAPEIHAILQQHVKSPTPEMADILDHLARQDFESFDDMITCATELVVDVILVDAVDRDMVVDQKIDASGNNFYARGMTDADYRQHVPDDIKKRLNMYFQVSEEANGAATGQTSHTSHTRSVTWQTYSQYWQRPLLITCHWLDKALGEVRESISEGQTYFDSHFLRSLELMKDYLVSGDEELFKQHSIEWLQTTSRLDYAMGFIESYHDPYGNRGHPGAEVTVKPVDMSRLNAVLGEIETRLPHQVAFMKTKESSQQSSQSSQSKQAIVNVSLNCMLWGTGDYGPLAWKAAYCLPNYDDIRAEVGSKQVIYKDLNEHDPEGWQQFCVPQEAALRRKYATMGIDKDVPEIVDTLWDVQVLLHEALGHSAGRLATHTVTRDEAPLIIDKQSYSEGQVVPVTADNYSQFISKDASSLEELRAEIAALYVGLTEIPVLHQHGLFQGWYERLGLEGLMTWIVQCACNIALRRYRAQQDGFTEVQGAHARADVVIANFLLSRGAIKLYEMELKEDRKAGLGIVGSELNPTVYTVYEFQVLNLGQCIASVTWLLQRVQEIKSCGLTKACRELFERYTAGPITVEQGRKIRTEGLRISTRLKGDIQATARIYPNYQCEQGLIKIGPPQSFIEQNLAWNRLMWSTEEE